MVEYLKAMNAVLDDAVDDFLDFLMVLFRYSSMVVVDDDYEI
jgi:hypothetical protein